jgi:hypothetical protein
LPSAAERLAEAAEGLPAFRGFKLLYVRDQVAAILAFVGRSGIFAQYTKHDISHVDRMLEMYDWLVPPTTARLMTPVDWLLLVLAAYFHDLGMVVTEDEFQQREKSAYPEYRSAVLSNPDYRAKVEALTADETERFLYGEFVRAHHAARIGAWVTGSIPASYGEAAQQTELIRDMLQHVPDDFRRDLGRVCESHHLEIRDDFDTYPTDQPYGAMDAETANVHYAALILRTADLLHITSDRTPTVEAKLINPKDPVSQLEWQKQKAVKRVRVLAAKNADGDDDPSLPTDAIAIYATFRDADAFFGLNAYINYARYQLRQTWEWAETARRRKAVTFEFPWRVIDDTYVRAEGFIPKQFEFELDQARILELLTGHTLYNDSSVVLRELVQNSLDAVRLRVLQDMRGGKLPLEPRVDIEWDSEARVLTVRDSGTGMSQDDIEQHFLRVGSSRYQDPDFVKEYPEFSAISRFGIGILSTFMVADTVDVYTANCDESMQGRHVALRSLHGRYLIRLIDDDALRAFGVTKGEP